MSKYPSRQIMYDYLNNRANAKRRGVDFQLTFEEWWTLWKSKYHLRGRGRGKYQLCRKGDIGPYSFANCYIDTHENNRAVQKPVNQKVSSVDAVIELRKKHSAKQIAEIFGVTSNHIQSIIRESKE